MKKLLLLSILLIVGCSKNSTEPNKNINNYTPLNLGDIRQIINLQDSSITYYEIVDTVTDGDDLHKAISDTSPSMVILEIDLPHLKGISSIKNLKKEFPGLRVLIFSCHPEEMYALSAIKAGAQGYVDKTADIDTVRNAIEQVRRGGIYINEKLVEMLSKAENNGRNLAYKYKRLSSREIEVLNMLSAGKRNKDIAESLDINEKTVSTYKTRLLKKLDAGSLAELIQQARLLQTSDL